MSMRCSVALVVLLGCSRVSPIAATSEPNKATAKRIAGTFQLVVSISSEHSCSQSF